MSDEPICDAWHQLAISEDLEATFFCELTAGHEGRHIAHGQNGLDEVSWEQESTP